MNDHHSSRSMVIVAVLLLLTLACPSFAADKILDNQRKAKNVVVMVADGMGLADVTAARIYKSGLNGSPLHFETLEQIGYQRTFSADSTITDSAAAASAWACGEKFLNGEICYHSDGKPYNPSILELARSKGKRTGLVATSTITHATPAAWAAHIHFRGCEKEIARQYIQVTEPDVMLGGGRSQFKSTTPDSCGTSGDFIAEAKNKGYTVALTENEMTAALGNHVRKLLGLFHSNSMTPEYSRPPDSTEPRLPEMAAAALSVLEGDPEGFFLFVEGSQIDSANHNNNLKYQLGETLAFDEAVKVVLDWINVSPERRNHTFLIVLADHETGGFAINGPDELLKPGEMVTPGWTGGDHTGADTLIWSQGPGSEALGKAIDNKDVYWIIKEAME